MTGATSSDAAPPSTLTATLSRSREGKRYARVSRSSNPGAPAWAAAPSGEEDPARLKDASVLSAPRAMGFAEPKEEPCSTSREKPLNGAAAS